MNEAVRSGDDDQNIKQKDEIHRLDKVILKNFEVIQGLKQTVVKIYDHLVKIDERDEHRKKIIIRHRNEINELKEGILILKEEIRKLKLDLKKKTKK